MKKTIKYAAVFSAGAGISGLVTWFLTKNKYVKLMNDELAEVDAAYREREKEIRAEVETKKKEKKVEPPVEKEEPKKATTKQTKKDVIVAVDAKDIERNGEIIEQCNYNTMAKSHKSAKKSQEHAKKDGPVIITMDEYVNDRRHEKVVVTYLDQEDMFLDENDEPIDINEIRDRVGTECTDIDYSEDSQTVYVRNDSFGIDYEIVIDDTHTFRSYLEEEGV